VAVSERNLQRNESFHSFATAHKSSTMNPPHAAKPIMMSRAVMVSNSF